MSSGAARGAAGRESNALLALIAGAIALNIAVNFLERRVGLPLFLGTFGTVLAGALGGPWAGGLVGALSNVIYGLAIHAESLPYAVVNLAIGIVAGFVARWFDRPGPTLVAALIIAVIRAATSAFIGTLVYGGVPGNGTHFVTASVLMTARTLRHYVSAAEFLMDIIDKIVICYLVFFVVRSRAQCVRVRAGAA